jgi:hypothetical protein
MVFGSRERWGCAKSNKNYGKGSAHSYEANPKVGGTATLAGGG